ncbi:hypothetical protein J1782_07300, partial [Rahnella sp. BCC 1045]|uniref:hypothetical protein n=1 Tax=Rahnella sp. BCC 1045 TaxID=2816251 RepID=UPI001C26BE1A
MKFLSCVVERFSFNQKINSPTIFIFSSTHEFTIYTVEKSKSPEYYRGPDSSYPTACTHAVG